MAFKKILIVPPESVVERRRPLGFAGRLLRPAVRLKQRLIAGTPYDAELMFWGDLPKVLGPENVYILGWLYENLYNASIPIDCAYPSCHGTPRGKSIAEDELSGALRDIDFLLISTRAGRRGELAIGEAKRRDRPVALLDFKDHSENYGRSVSEDELCRGFKRGRDFDLYFKKDLPFGRANDFIRPLAPVPVRPESYAIPESDKEVDVFYSGRSRSGCQADRGETIDLVKANFPGAVIFEHELKRQSFFPIRRYWRELGRARLTLSPSGKVWDSLRHCEAGLAPGTALIAPKPYVETVGPPFEDGKNALLYETKFREGKYHLADADGLVEKIRYYLVHPAEREAIASAWTKDVMEGHTVLARSKYIAETMEQAFSHP